MSGEGWKKNFFDVKKEKWVNFLKEHRGGGGGGGVVEG